MNEETYQFLLALSIALPVLASFIRLRQLPQSFYPFVYLVSIGLINEIVSFAFFRHSSNAIPTNIYNLIEYMLYCWQFRNWKHILVKNYSFYGIIGAVVLFWIVDEIILGKLGTYSSFFLIIYPFILVLIAVNELNYLVANEHSNIIKNAIFIFCVAIIIYYSYRILSEIFYRYAHNSEMQSSIFQIQIYVNVLFNILLTLVVICLPKKRIITRQ